MEIYSEEFIIVCLLKDFLRISRYNNIVDLRGFGDSTYNNSIKDLSDDLYDFVNKLGIWLFTIVGWSARGSVCMQYRADYPDMV